MDLITKYLNYKKPDTKRFQPLTRKEWIGWFAQRLHYKKEGLEKWRIVARKLKVFKDTELQRVFNACLEGDFDKEFTRQYNEAKKYLPKKPKQLTIN